MEKHIFAVGHNIIIEAKVLQPKKKGNLMLPKGTQTDKLIHENLADYFDGNPYTGRVVMIGEFVNAVPSEYPDAKVQEIKVGDIVTLRDERRLEHPLILNGKEHHLITKNDISIVERSQDV